MRRGRFFLKCVCVVNSHKKYKIIKQTTIIILAHFKQSAIQIPCLKNHPSVLKLPESKSEMNPIRDV